MEFWDYLAFWAAANHSEQFSRGGANITKCACASPEEVKLYNSYYADKHIVIRSLGPFKFRVYGDSVENTLEKLVDETKKLAFANECNAVTLWEPDFYIWSDPIYAVSKGVFAIVGD